MTDLDPLNSPLAAVSSHPMRDLASRAVTVGAIAAAEKVRKPPLRSSADVPISGAYATPEWLTEVLCRDVPGAEVASVSTHTASQGTSNRVGLRVAYNDVGRSAGLPTDLFTKATETFRQRLLFGGAGVLEGEPRFYRFIRPKTTVEAPQGYWVGADRRSWRSLVIMEDVAATKGARFVDPTMPLSQAQVEDLVQNIARLHGELWGDSVIDRLSTPRRYIDHLSAFANVKARCAVGMQRADAEIPSELRGKNDRLFEATVRSMTMASEAPRTALHGDCHVGQSYVTSDGKMGLGDWQGCQHGLWAFDFAYLVNSACEPDDRRQWAKGLMELYLERLAEHGGVAPTFDDAWLAYRQQSFWPYTAWVFTIGRAWYQPKMQTEPICKTIIRRTAAAIADLEALDAVGV